MTSVSPRRNNAPGGFPDARLRRVTMVFGHIYPGPKNTQRAIDNQEIGGARCEVSGVWFPTSRLVKDGFGRTVGDIFYTEESQEWSGWPF